MAIKIINKTKDKVIVMDNSRKLELTWDEFNEFYTSTKEDKYKATLNEKYAKEVEIVNSIVKEITKKTVDTIKPKEVIKKIKENVGDSKYFTDKEILRIVNHQISSKKTKPKKEDKTKIDNYEYCSIGEMIKHKR